MNNMDASEGTPRLLGAKWIAVTVLAWTLSPLPGGATVHSVDELWRFIVAYLVSGALLGVLLGLGQAWALKLHGREFGNWVLVTLVGYAVGLPASLALAGGSALADWPADLPPLNGAANVFMEIGLQQTVLAGLLVGLGQWRLMPSRTVTRTPRSFLLWLLSNVAGLGLGALTASIMVGISAVAQGQIPPAPGAAEQALARAAVGLVFALITGAAWWVLRRGDAGKISNVEAIRLPLL